MDVTSDPTSPAPASILKFTKSIELPLLRETLLAAAIVAPVAADVKNVCSELWAVVASVRLSCCRMSRTPTLAKSRACCETVKVVLGVVVAGADVAVVAVDIDSGVVVGASVDVVEGNQSVVIVRVIVIVVVGESEDKPIVSVVVVDWPAIMVRVAMPTAAASTTLFSSESANATFETALASLPLKVTRAF